MTRKQDDNSKANQSFTLPTIVGTWESLNLHPTVMIYPKMCIRDRLNEKRNPFLADSFLAVRTEDEP